MTSTVALAGLFLSASLFQNGPGPELKPFQGEWLLISTADRRATDAGSASIRMEIGEEGRLIYRLDQLVTNRGTIKILLAGKLKQIDLTLEDGQTYRGVCELNANYLTVCFSEAGNERPRSVRPAERQWAETWKRP